MIGRVLLAILFMVSGSLHFFAPPLYLRIMPPYLPAPLALVYISGVAEILGGAGLLIPSTRQAAAWGLIALLIAVLPANIYMATAHLSAPGDHGTKLGAVAAHSFADSSHLLGVALHAYAVENKAPAQREIATKCSIFVFEGGNSLPLTKPASLLTDF